MALRVSRVHEGLFHSYNLFLFATPYTAYSILLSGCMSSPSLSTRESVRANCLLILTRATATIYFWLSARVATSASPAPVTGCPSRRGSLHRPGNRRRTR
jgi:hypothetical protein